MLASSAALVYCADTIITDGIQLISSIVSLSDVISFEIREADEDFCLAFFATESDFISTLFSMNGEYQIRLVTEDYELIGYVAL